MNRLRDLHSTTPVQVVAGIHHLRAAVEYRAFQCRVPRPGSGASSGERLSRFPVSDTSSRCPKPETSGVWGGAVFGVWAADVGVEVWAVSSGVQAWLVWRVASCGAGVVGAAGGGGPGRLLAVRRADRAGCALGSGASAHGGTGAGARRVQSGWALTPRGGEVRSVLGGVGTVGHVSQCVRVWGLADGSGSSVRVWESGYGSGDLMYGSGDFTRCEQGVCHGPRVGEEVGCAG